MKVKTNFGATGISRYFFKRAIKYGSIGNTHAAAVPKKGQKKDIGLFDGKTSSKCFDDSSSAQYCIALHPGRVITCLLSHYIET